jgi:putative molybdopterin biosynthesis protein
MSHLYDHDQGDFNFPLIRDYFPNPDELVVINLFHRTVGFVSRNEEVQSFRQCLDNALRFVNRQLGSGIRALVDHLLAEEGIRPADLKGYDTQLFTHFDVVRSVASSQSDVGIAAESVSLGSQLKFFPVFEERFDMVAKKEVFFDRNIQAFVEFIRSDVFRVLLRGMKGYSDRETGRVVYPRQPSG